MERILEILCDSPIGTNALPHAPGSPEMKTIRTRMDLMERLRAQLTPQQVELLDRYEDLGVEVNDDFCYRKFNYGFCLGAFLMMELYQERAELLGL